MKGFGDISAEVAQHTSDLAFQTVKLGQTTILELSTAIMKVADNSASIGITEEEIFTFCNISWSYWWRSRSKS